MSVAEEVARDGYAVVDGVLPEHELDLMRDEMTSLIEDAQTQVRPEDHPEDYSFEERPDGSRVLLRISRQLARSAVMRRVYANPALLRLVEEAYGKRFVPFAESIIVKLPGIGARVPWHQDGGNHDVDARGINVGIYLHDATEANGCLRVIPASHRQGKIDVRSMREEHGDILPGSVSLEVKAGQIALHDRSLVHGSLPNESSDLRVTVYFGFHRLDAVEGIHPPEAIRRRAQMVSLCIDERQSSAGVGDGEPYHYALSEIAPIPSSAEREQVLRAAPLML